MQSNKKGWLLHRRNEQKLVMGITRQRLKVNYVKYAQRPKGNHRQRPKGNQENSVSGNRIYQ